MLEETAAPTERDGDAAAGDICGISAALSGWQRPRGSLHRFRSYLHTKEQLLCCYYAANFPVVTGPAEGAGEGERRVQSTY